MPYTAGSLATCLKAEFEEAYEQLLQAGDPEVIEASTLPSTLDGVPKWNSHSARRGGTKRARATMELSEAKEEDINYHFGWVEEAMKGGRKRQVAYAGTCEADRRVRVTCRF